MNINNWKSSPNWDSLLFEDMSGFSDYDYTPVYSVDATLAPPPPKTKSGTIARPTATGGKTQTVDSSKIVTTGVVKQPTNPKTISSQLQADKPASITIKQKVVAPVVASGGGGGGGGGVSEPDKPEETPKPTEEKKGMNVKALAVVAAIGVGVIYYFNK